MIQKIIISILISVFILSEADAAEINIGLNAIQNRHHVVCGTSRDYKYLSNQREKIWTGLDADICRAIAAATIGDAESFKILPVAKENIGKALNSGKIDIMLGNYMLSSSEKNEMFVLPVSPLYINKIIFASRYSKEAESMKSFSKSRVCALRDSPVKAIVETYSLDHALGFSILELPSLASLKEAFYLRRCDLLCADEVFVKSAILDLKNSDAEILPEVIGYLPVSAYSSARNPQFNTILNLIIDTLKYAHRENISSKNIETFKMSKSPAIQNLLGYNEAFWKSQDLSPQWVSKYISTYGNYNQILEKNLGPLSPLNLEIKHNDLIENGGFLTSVPAI